MNEEIYQFKLTFDGNLVENSVDAFDIANTILATSAALKEIAEIKYGKEKSESIKININAFNEGSLISEFLIFVKDNAPAVVPLIPEFADKGYKIGKEILSTLSTVIDIKQKLQGKIPDEVKQLDANNIQITGNGHTFNINYIDFRALQDKTVARNVAKAIQPLLKPQSEVTSIKLNEDGTEITEITKETAPYLGNSEDMQTVSNIKYKGTISKIDRKVCSGYIDVGSKRISFNYPKDLPQEKYAILVESLRSQIQIYLIGEVIMDFESNPRLINVKDVESDLKLFE